MERPDVLAQIAAAAAHGRRDRITDRAELAALWSPAAPALERCALALALADLQDDPSAELAWDRAALAAGEQVSDAALAGAGAAVTAAALLPSLHLNLGDAYRRLGDLDAARVHVQRCEAALASLPASPYLAEIRAALARVADAIAG